MPYTLLVQELRDAHVSKASLEAYLEGKRESVSESILAVLDARKADIGVPGLQKALVRWDALY
ncbi:hypothetical protein GS445_17915 [Rhodococcus hoagii]|uniref:hypothetical protein n=1 Tax=Rhodococcus hoagii TaxID=43767 RepID=UPI0019814814|nr:hypothetical protein [Prescottella equi]MBM4551516.1 hypothetical protein [Prescottella equi]